MPIDINIGGIGLSVGNVVGSSVTSPTLPNNTTVPNLVTSQMLVPIRNV